MATYDVNPAAVEKARSLIAARHYVLDSDWGAVQPDAAAGNAYLERHSWEEYEVAAHDLLQQLDRTAGIT